MRDNTSFPNYISSIMGFLNLLIIDDELLRQRNNTRAELANLKFMMLLEDLKKINNTDLMIQIKLYQDSQEKDETEAFSENGFDLNNSYDLFNAISLKIQQKEKYQQKFNEVLQLIFLADESIDGDKLSENKIENIWDRIAEVTKNATQNFKIASEKFDSETQTDENYTLTTSTKSNETKDVFENLKNDSSEASLPQLPIIGETDNPHKNEELPSTMSNKLNELSESKLPPSGFIPPPPPPPPLPRQLRPQSPSLDFIKPTSELTVPSLQQQLQPTPPPQPPPPLPRQLQPPSPSLDFISPTSGLTPPPPPPPFSLMGSSLPPPPPPPFGKTTSIPAFGPITTIVNPIFSFVPKPLSKSIQTVNWQKLPENAISKLTLIST